MKRNLAVQILLALGIMGASLAATVSHRLGWSPMTGPAVMALAVLATGWVDSSNRFRSRPSPIILVCAGALLVSGAVLEAIGGSTSVQVMPMMGLAVWATLLPGSTEARAACARRMRVKRPTDS